jgi:DNA-binding protein H-NS
MAMDLNSYSLSELKDLQGKVAKAIAGFADRKKREALSAAEEVARQHGFSLSELTGSKTTRKRTPSSVTYVNPANRADTWSGRGRQPRWFAEALKSGRSKDSLKG